MQLRQISMRVNLVRAGSCDPRTARKLTWQGGAQHVQNAAHTRGAQEEAQAWHRQLGAQRGQARVRHARHLHNALCEKLCTVPQWHFVS